MPRDTCKRAATTPSASTPPAKQSKKATVEDNDSSDDDLDMDNCGASPHPFNSGGAPSTGGYDSRRVLTLTFKDETLLKDFGHLTAGDVTGSCLVFGDVCREMNPDLPNSKAAVEQLPADFAKPAGLTAINAVTPEVLKAAAVPFRNPGSSYKHLRPQYRGHSIMLASWGGISIAVLKHFRAKAEAAARRVGYVLCDDTTSYVDWPRARFKTNSAGDYFLTNPHKFIPMLKPILATGVDMRACPHVPALGAQLDADKTRLVCRFHDEDACRRACAFFRALEIPMSGNLPVGELP